MAGWTGEVLAAGMQDTLDEVENAWRLTTLDMPIPFSAPLEDLYFPGSEAIVASVVKRLGAGALTTRAVATGAAACPRPSVPGASRRGGRSPR